MSSFEEAYNITGHGKVNHLALLTCGLILLSVTTECLGLGYVLSIAECDLNISMSDRGIIGASTLMGLVVPSILWGYLADVYGRRLVMLPPILAAFLSSICSALKVKVKVKATLAVNFWNIFLMRLLTGLLLSGSCSTVYVYLGELHTPSRRTSAIAWASAFIAVSFFSMPAMAWVIIPRKWSVHIAGPLTLVPWRAYICSWGIWSGMAAIGLWILPESPRYLLATKGPDAALPVLAKIYAWNHNKKPADYPVTKIVSDHAQGPPLSFKATVVRMKYMLRQPLLRCVLISHYCNFLVYTKVTGFSFWTPHIMNELLHNPTSSESMCSMINAKSAAQPETSTPERCAEVEVDTLLYPISMVSGVLTAILYLCLGFVIEKCGKRMVFCTIMLVCSGFIMASAVVPNAYLAIALLVPGMCGITGSSVLAAVAIEAFPTSLRALALCTLFMIGRLGGAFGAHVVGLAMQDNCTPIVVAVTAMTGGSSLLMAFWPDAEKIRVKMEAKDFVY